MIKDKLAEAVKAGLDNMKKGSDKIPLSMRGELEVIVKDREGNVLSYERGCNQVTNLAKMAIIHLLAGEVGVEDDTLYSTVNTNNSILRGVSKEAASGAAVVSPRFVPGNHTTGQNLDGVLVSGEQFFYDGSDIVNVNINKLSQVRPLDNSFSFNFPTKMLFGTGVEAYNTDTMETAYIADAGTTVANGIMSRLNGYNNDAISNTFFSNCAELSDWYSNSAYRSRTLQPSTTTAKDTSPLSTDTAISGAIKNCLITSDSSSDAAKYNPSTHMATPDCRGFGYPCFIYAKRSTGNFPVVDNTDKEVYYQMNNALSDNPYESELTYTVVMPAQAIGNTTISAFYPYNGWILKQAGLFSDSRYMLRSNNTGEYSETTFINKVNGTAEQSDNASIYRNSIGGQLLFTRNLSSPIIKTPDNEVTFIWHIFVAI